MPVGSNFRILNDYACLFSRHNLNPLHPCDGPLDVASCVEVQVWAEANVPKRRRNKAPDYFSLKCL
jgi:hypothetical protein